MIAVFRSQQSGTYEEQKYCIILRRGEVLGWQVEEVKDLKRNSSEEMNGDLSGTPDPYWKETGLKPESPTSWGGIGAFLVPTCSWRLGEFFRPNIA